MIQNTKDFKLLVLEMRTAQKAYFANRTNSSLQLSKKLEAEIDAILAKAPRQLDLYSETEFGKAN